MLKQNQRINRGIFSFLSRRGLSMAGMRRVLHLYAQSKDMNKPNKNKLEWYAKISEEAHSEFQAFKKIYNKNKHNIPHYQTYEDAWSESNLDGSFAYNGVTEDF